MAVDVRAEINPPPPLIVYLSGNSYCLQTWHTDTFRPSKVGYLLVFFLRVMESTPTSPIELTVIHKAFFQARGLFQENPHSRTVPLNKL